MKKRLLMLLNMIYLLPIKVLADEMPPSIPTNIEEETSGVYDFTIVFISILTILVIIGIFTFIKNKRGK